MATSWLHQLAIYLPLLGLLGATIYDSHEYGYSYQKLLWLPVGGSPVLAPGTAPPRNRAGIAHGYPTGTPTTLPSSAPETASPCSSSTLRRSAWRAQGEPPRHHSAIQIDHSDMYIYVFLSTKCFTYFYTYMIIYVYVVFKLYTQLNIDIHVCRIVVQRMIPNTKGNFV